MALAEAGHTGILGVAAQMLLSKLADLSGRNGELKRTLERHGRGLFLLGFRSSSLFDGLFSLFFSHRFDLYVISIRFAPKTTSGAGAARCVNKDRSAKKLSRTVRKICPS